MCLPKAPAEDPAVKEAQKRQREIEAERLAEEKKKKLADTKATQSGTGIRSLISGSSSGYGSNY